MNLSPRLAALALCASFAAVSWAQTPAPRLEGTNPTRQNLFVTDSTSAAPYRIPALAKAHNGDLVAVSDYRPCGSDIGYGRVDLVERRSIDNGATWSPERTIVAGTGEAGTLHCGFGDAALVADGESGDLLLICVAGNTVYFRSKRSEPMPVCRLYSHDNGNTWSAPEEITQQVYGLFDQSKLGAVDGLFAGSGRICQSRVVKAGSHYRLYMALCAHPGGNRVVYSDDFGKTWAVLGGVDSAPAPKGDEPKCEELPDGTVILSSRADGGRLFNLFTYTDARKAAGNWGEVAFSGEANRGTVAKGNACNGEILILPAVRQSDRRELYVALQSVPLGPGRVHVGVYYKELASRADFATPAAFAADWDGCLQVSRMNSAYSTMTLQGDGRIGFFYEEETFGKAYTNVYEAFTLGQLTGGSYEYAPSVSCKAYVKAVTKGTPLRAARR